jgi:nitroreductase
MSSATEPELFEIMSQMRAMRRLRPDPVPAELLDRLIQAAVWAPSGSNLQAYQYLVITDRAVIGRLAPLWERCVDAYLATAGKNAPGTMDDEAYRKMVAAIRYQRDHFAETPALIIPCYRYKLPTPTPAGLREMRASLGTRATLRLAANRVFSVIAETSSLYPGVQNLLLTARALGLGATLTMWHLMLEPEFKQVLGIPKGVHTYAVIPVGYPVGKFGPVSRLPIEKVIRRDRW